MASLLAKFRIKYSDLIVIKNLKQVPKPSTKTWFDNLINDFVSSGQIPGKYHCCTKVLEGRRKLIYYSLKII